MKLPGLILISIKEEKCGNPIILLISWKEYLDAQNKQGVAKIAVSQFLIPETISFNKFSIFVPFQAGYQSFGV